eukprot:scaffold5873_cov172-Amphora_coffeaeformis.AAC.14
MSLLSVAPSPASLAAPPTASGFLALLQEEDVVLQEHALKQLLVHVDTLWHEMAAALPELEALAEGQQATVSPLAAAVASRVFFHLDEAPQALKWALQAGSAYLTDATDGSPYVQRLVAAALDAYIEEKTQDTEEKKSGEPPLIPPEALAEMVEGLVSSACSHGHFRDALGLALEARQVQQVEHILQAANSLEFLRYSVTTVQQFVMDKAWRAQVLQLLVRALEDRFPQETACDCVLLYQWLGRPSQVALVLSRLLKDPVVDQQLLGLQLVFDLTDAGDQAFCQAVAQEWLNSKTSEEGEGKWTPAMDQGLRVLQGGFAAELAVSFLHKQSAADRHYMESIRKALEERSSSRTTNDSFLRDYLDWMKKASNWAKFSATASLGVVHASHITEAMHLLQPYLPTAPASDGGPNSAVSPTGGFAEGGALYALGLIHGSHAGSSAEGRKTTTDFLRSHLRISHANEVISHGAALGIGLTALGTADAAIVQELKELLDSDSAVAGEAAGIAMGMVLVGTGRNHTPDVAMMVEELKSYARETQHEKIIRGIAMGLALMCYGQEEQADTTIEEMRADRDPIMRYGAQYAIALAYCGTGSQKAVRILLHTAVSDVSDDVRMAAVLGLAFVLYKTPERVPELVKLLLESFNPHVRYASCMAVGIAMAGSGDAASITLLEPMLEDTTDYVRQGALLGTAMVYMQQADSRKTRAFREKLLGIMSEKHQSMLTKMGAIMAAGLMDAGGRNVAIRLGSARNGFTKMSTAVGLALWLQHWHWFPLMQMLSLALTPTLTIGLNQDFKYPKSFTITCNAKPSQFAYPKKMEEKKEEKKVRVETVTLSTTAKQLAREARKKNEKEGGPTAMEVDESEKKEENKEEKTEGDEGEGKKEEQEKKKRKKEPEPTSFKISNPSRVTHSQANVCVFTDDQRYRPILPTTKPMGVIILTDTTPNAEEEEDFGAVLAPSMEPEGELPPPEPFEWTPPARSSAPAPAAEATKTEEAEEMEE